MSLPAQEITVRPIRYDEFENGRSVYKVRNHAGTISLDPAVLKDVRTMEVRVGGPYSSKDGQVVGHESTARIKSIYGWETSVHLFDSQRALEAKHSDRFPTDRERALENQADPGVYVEDPDGDRVLPVTPVWGAEAMLTVLVEDADPTELQAAIEQMIAERFPGARIPKWRTRPVADRRVNVYELDYSTMRPVGKGQFSEPGRTPVALHVLEAESRAIISGGGGNNMIEQVSPGAPMPVVGR